MSKATKALWVYIALMSVLCVWGGYLTFGNPDMTRTRLLLTFWPHYLGMLALSGVVLLWLREELRR